MLQRKYRMLAEMPWFMGCAWIDIKAEMIVAYPVPVNLFVAYTRRLWFWAKTGPGPSLYERKVFENAHCKEQNKAIAKAILNNPDIPQEIKAHLKANLKSLDIPLDDVLGDK